MAHFRYAHGCHSVSRVDQVLVDGPRLQNRFDFTRRRKIAKIAALTPSFSAITLVFGLGYSFVEIREHSIGMDLRLWVLATSVDGTHIDLSLVSQVREIRNPRWRIVGLGILPPRLRAPIMNKLMATFQHKDVMQDVVIWSRKRYRPRPRPCRSDSEIMPYRTNCAQFYSDPHGSAEPVPASTEETAL